MQQIRNRKQFLFMVAVMLAFRASSPCTSWLGRGTSTDLEGELDLTQSCLPHLIDETLRPERVSMTDPSILRGYSQIAFFAARYDCSFEEQFAFSCVSQVEE